MKTILIVLIATPMIAILINIIGWNLYLLIPINSRNLHIGAANGVFHTSLIEPSDQLTDEAIDDFQSFIGREITQIQLVKISRFELFLETRIENMMPMWDRFSANITTKSMDLPLLVFPLIFSILFFVMMKKIDH